MSPGVTNFTKCHVQIYFTILLFIFSPDAVQLAQGNDEELGADIHETKQFSMRLYKALSGKSGNLLISPLGLHTTLVLAFTASEGETASELANLLLLTSSLNDTYLQYHELLKSIQSPVLHLTSRMFVEAKASLKDEFLKKASKFLISTAETADFKEAPKKAKNHIDKWLKHNTNRKIKNLFPSGTFFSKNTTLVLANALYFEGQWRNRFSENQIKKQPFYRSKTIIATIEMMHTRGNFWYSHDSELEAQILKLDYSGGQFRMVVILPDETEGLAKLEAKLDKTIVFKNSLYHDPPIVNVALPKFKIERTLDLTSVLQSFGLKHMFSSKANFSRLTDSPVFVSGVIQKSLLGVNEEGAEASVGTGTSVMRGSFLLDLEQEIDFNADHPFIFMVTTVEKNIPVLIGRFTGP